MRTLFDSIDADKGGSIDRDEWMQFFCPDRDSVPRALVYDPESAECQKVSGFIFDCDGTIYQLNPPPTPTPKPLLNPTPHLKDVNYPYLQPQPQPRILPLTYP